VQIVKIHVFVNTVIQKQRDEIPLVVEFDDEN